MARKFDRGMAYEKNTFPQQCSFVKREDERAEGVKVGWQG